MKIRLSDTNDQQAICTVHHSAFGEEERNSIVELAMNFLSQPSDYFTLSFVADEKGIVVGHIIFSEIKFKEQYTKAFTPNIERSTSNTVFCHFIKRLSKADLPFENMRFA